jgi:hypothetical protein
MVEVTGRKVVRSSSDGHCIFQIYVIIPAAPWSWHWLSLEQMGIPDALGKVRAARKDAKLAAICEPIV